MLGGVEDLKTVNDEKKIMQEKQDHTLSKIDIRQNDIIITDNYPINFSVADVYFYGIERKEAAALRDAEKGTIYWLFLNDKLDDEIHDQLSKKGFDCEYVIEDGMIGQETVQIYRLY